MRFDYMVYPEAIEKIKVSGIEARVQELKDSRGRFPYIGGCVYESDVAGKVSYLKENGFYDRLPDDFASEYEGALSSMLRRPEEHLWSVRRPEGMVTEGCELEDLLLFSGYYASHVLRPEELWDCGKFGFESPTGFIAAVGAYVKKQSGYPSSREGYKWATKRTDGSEILTSVTGDMDCDLRVFQTDIAPYDTMDPFGNLVLLRPELASDRHMIAAYHSTEGAMLVTVMKYVEQEGIDVDYCSDGARRLIEWGRSLGQGGGTCAEHFGGFDQEPMLFFPGYNIRIPRLNESDETDEHSIFRLGTLGGGGYAAYVSHEGDLVFSYQGDGQTKNPKKDISARFLPVDAEHVIRGLIYQSAIGLGRTSANQLLGILDYRYSDRFVEDQKRFK